MIADIVEQLTEYCDCVDTPEEKDVQEIVNLISMFTCWTNEPCDTFLLGPRQEVIEIPPCMDCAFEFEPFYHPFDLDTFKFTLIERNETTITQTVVEDYVYLNGRFYINLPLPDCKCMSKRCGCDPEYTLLVEYDAGYEGLPDCLLPVFCNLLDVIQAKNKCDCEKDCACNTEESIQYATGDVVTAALETDLGKILVEQYKRQLSLIALCDDSREVWGFVV